MKTPCLMSLSETFEKEFKARKARLKTGQWGAWHLTRDPLCLGINRSYPYEDTISHIELEGPLKWLAHVSEKTWLERGDIENLIKAFQDIFGPLWLGDAAFNPDKKLKIAKDVKALPHFPEAQ